MSPFECYKMFRAVKSHFTTDYDYFKYNGKMKINYETFETRNDSYSFSKLSKHRDPLNLVVSNVFKNPSIWVRDLFSEQAEIEYSNFVRRQESQTFSFTEDLEKLCTSLEENLIVKNGQYPHLLKLLIGNKIDADTVIIMNSILNFFPYWDKNIEDNVIWPSKKRSLEKLKGFITFSKEKCKKALDDHHFTDI